jgi:5-methylcytosine-specific restriction endonuclease McrA
MPEQRVSMDLRRRVTARAQGCCEYCSSQAQYATEAFSVEHILARAKGGTTRLENLALAYQGCNNRKYDKTDAPDPVRGQLVPLYHPRRDRWAEHFTWSMDFTLIIGLTPSGHASVEALALNRNGVANLRRLLYSVG